MASSFVEQINDFNLNKGYNKQEEFLKKAVAYGTAGFRMRATGLDWIMYRMGLLACLRSICKECKYIGCMITASHNPEEDNGCKLVDPHGDMLEAKWEQYATELVNSNDLSHTLLRLCQVEFKSSVDEFDAKNRQLPEGQKLRPRVVVGYDTRPSSLLLYDAFKTGVEALGGELVNYGLLSTPQLHYMVRCLNTSGAYGRPTEEGYFGKLAGAFFSIWEMIDFEKNNKYDFDLFIDGANGIGANKVRDICKVFAKMAEEKQITSKINIHLFNEAKLDSDKLNHLCGADFVKVQQKPPANLPGDVAETNNNRIRKVRKYCSLDGDADRVVYYYMDQDESGKETRFFLLDGDKISTLVATHLRELVADADLAGQISLSIVQTAYANGSSTDYIENSMKVHASCVPTGVKYLHHEAEKFDIGVYFEANGHGTILFSPKAETLIEQKYKQLIEEVYSGPRGGELRQALIANKSLYALYNLKHLKDCINQTVGDALSDLLVVELILASRNLSVHDWNGQYTDLPSRQLKVTIRDRALVKTYDAERRVSEPAELQTQLDEAVRATKCKSARAFVRPSGTEDVVRVYAEADTQENADALAKRVSQLVYDLAGGVGSRP